MWEAWEVERSCTGGAGGGGRQVRPAQAVADADRAGGRVGQDARDQEGADPVLAGQVLPCQGPALSSCCMLGLSCRVPGLCTKAARQSLERPCRMRNDCMVRSRTATSAGGSEGPARTCARRPG